VTRSRTHSRAHGDDGVTDAQTSPFGSGLTHIVLCTDDHGQSFVGRLHQDPSDSYTNNQAMDFLKAEIARLLADPPPYEDRSLARKVREMYEAKALIDESHRLDHRQN
jgi:hypothetical protein